MLWSDVNEFATLSSAPVAHAVENQLYLFYTIAVTDEDVDSTYVMTIVSGNNGTRIQVRKEGLAAAPTTGATFAFSSCSR